MRCASLTDDRVEARRLPGVVAEGDGGHRRRQVIDDLARLVNPTGRLGIAGVFTAGDATPAQEGGHADGMLRVPWAALFNKGVTVGFGRTHDALAQHVLPGIAGTVATRPGPFLTEADSMKITVYGRGGHGSMPQNTVDPVVLAALITVRLQTVVSREVSPGETAVLTVGSLQAGTKSNIIPDRAVLQLNLRSYSQPTRQRMMDAIQRMVRAECQASGTPRDPDFETFDSFPLTDNDADTTSRVAAAFRAHFGDQAQEAGQQTASEDFSDVPRAAGIPYTYWSIGGTDPDTYRDAEKAGRVQDDIPANHSPKFLPVLQPTLRTGTEALVTAALARSLARVVGGQQVRQTDGRDRTATAARA